MYVAKHKSSTKGTVLFVHFYKANNKNSFVGLVI